LTYTAEVTTPIDVTITASAPNADPKSTVVTLTVHGIISIQTTASSIDYHGTATISATCTSGAPITLSASGDGKDQN
jgi:hypothetical protein